MGRKESSSEIDGEDAARRAWSVMCELVLDNERRRAVGAALDLSFGRVKALRRIARNPMSMRDLAATLEIDAPYATLVVDELERRGFVERRAHPTDRRVKLVTATAQGLRAARRAEQIMGEPPTVLSDLPAASLDKLARILETARARSEA